MVYCSLAGNTDERRTTRRFPSLIPARIRKHAHAYVIRGSFVFKSLGLLINALNYALACFAGVESGGGCIIAKGVRSPDNYKEPPPACGINSLHVFISPMSRWNIFSNVCTLHRSQARRCSNVGQGSEKWGEISKYY